MYVIQKFCWLFVIFIFPDDLCICNRFVPDFTECDMAFIYSRCFLMLIMMLGIGKILAVINVTFADITYFTRYLRFSHVWISNFLSAGSIITSDAEDNDYCKSTLYSYCNCKRMYYGEDISRLEVVGNCKCVCRWMLFGRERLF